MNKADMVSLYAQLFMIRRELLHVNEDANSMLYFLKDGEDGEEYVDMAEELSLHLKNAYTIVIGWLPRVRDSLDKDISNN